MKNPTQWTRRSALTAGAAWLTARPAAAVQTPYQLVSAASSVGFTFTLAGVPQSGTMPVKSAKIAIDTGHLERSQVEVILDVEKAKTKPAFARGAMLGPGVLDAERYPTVRFVSTRIRLGKGGRLSDGAKITGDLTVRDVTRPVTLDAALYRVRGSDPRDLTVLTFDLTGDLSRKEFGASGFPDFVADRVGLNIRAVIQRQR